MTQGGASGTATAPVPAASRESNFMQASLQLLASLLDVREGLPSRLQGRHSTKKTSCRRGLQGPLVPMKRYPEPKCAACNAHLRGAENNSGHKFQELADLCLWANGVEQIQGHRNAAWVIWEIGCVQEISLSGEGFNLPFYIKYSSLWWEIQWAVLCKVTLIANVNEKQR